MIFKNFEDIIYILDNCPDLLKSISNANVSVKAYLKAECQSLLNNDNLTEGIERALYSSDSDRTELIVDLIREIAEMELPHSQKS